MKRTILLGMIVSGSVLGTAYAQNEPVGRVVAIEGPAGSVIVLRGSQAYALQPNDILFSGDQVFTRTNGVATLSAYGCERDLNAASSIKIDAEVCLATPVSLDNNSVLGGVAVAAPAASNVGAAPVVLPFVAAGTAAAAAAGASNSQSASEVF